MLRFSHVRKSFLPETDDIEFQPIFLIQEKTAFVQNISVRAKDMDSLSIPPKIVDNADADTCILFDTVPEKYTLKSRWIAEDGYIVKNGTTESVK